MIHEPATKGDVVAIVALVAASVFGILLCPYAASKIDRFVPMFSSLKVELPGLTRLVLGYGWLLGGVVAPAVAIGGWVVYARLGDLGLKLGTAIVALLVTWSLFGCIVVGIWSPILELQKQLA